MKPRLKSLVGAVMVAAVIFPLTLMAVEERKEYGVQLDVAIWNILGRTTDVHHHSPLTEINDESIENLGLAWASAPLFSRTLRRFSIPFVKYPG